MISFLNIMSELGERKIEDEEVQTEKADVYRPDLTREEKVGRQVERMETKLYVPRKVDGEPNREELEIIKGIEEKLSQHPAFIGVSGFGSSIAGYGNKSLDSDVDIKLIYDESKFKDLEDNIEFLEMVKSIFPNGALEPNFINGKKIHFFREMLYIDQIEHDFKSYSKEYYPEHFLVHGIAEISRIVTGDKINKYRAKITRLIQDLPKDRRDRLMNLVIDLLSEFDKKSLVKRSSRMPEVANQKQQEILEKRKEMWKKRVEKIWGINTND